MSGAIKDWKVDFKDAAGETLFTASGQQSILTFAPMVAANFVERALVQMEQEELAIMRVHPLRNQWDHIVVDAKDFGIDNEKLERSDVPDEQIASAERQAFAETFGVPSA